MGMLTEFGLTDKQMSLARLIADGVPQKVAEVAAGYADTNGVTVWKMLQNANVQAAIHMLVRRKLTTEAAPVALKVLLEVANDTTAPKGARVDAAKTLLDRAGHVAPRAKDSVGPDDRPLTEYSVDELRKLVDDLERRRGDTAMPVNAPLWGGDTPQAVDMLE